MRDRTQRNELGTVSLYESQICRPAKKNPSRLINGVASLALGAPVALKLIFEVA